MDFSAQYPFPGGQPYQNFIPIPPLTPSHSHSAASDDYNVNSNTNASPPEAFDSLPPGDQFNGFDLGQPFAAHHQNQSFPGPPTPPTQAQYGHQQHHGATSQHLQDQNGSANGVDYSGNDLAKSEHSFDDLTQPRGGSEEDDLTPAQSRRKAQNRAAQRAFRERKEKHVKDLEVKLADLEAAQQQAATENERLKHDLQKMSTENEILRATSQMGGHQSGQPQEPHTGPMKYNPTDFYSNVLQGHTNKAPSHRVVTGADGERLLAAGATWDFIISHDLFKRGMVNVGGVAERLKHAARCDGQGPVFSEQDIVDALQQSVASGSDDLL